ncbi:putative signal transduction protein with EAL and GGDEF domain/DNA-binding response OmpR family regulator [Inhella inkyongensis]|uniref:Putative signal transduction protein with EAL and GGDEF domain/DNA-binding response OmpR family regulator n=1 Tax=Inhella inkyongensis TaxID=392593 RepID=A0A840SC55_9BURK|nr:EAL domain-containing protein [Inhella inkyongensis]MBB5205930.1 putative signal transduction protein with EAL and GGDEF domain/DNA-binding response OmpR family regulator [Inhella inkyongensis]
MKEPAQIPPAESARVLLVDDDEVSLLATAAALRARGFQTVELNSGEAALAWLAEHNVDVLVLDALMPEPDGFETCRRLRAQAKTASLPILMLTGLDDDASIERAYEVGATDFFVKTRQWGLLAGRLRYLLRAARTREELERSKARLARAQDLARMGSLEWKPGQGLSLSAESLRVLGLESEPCPRLDWLLQRIPRSERQALVGLLKELSVQPGPLLADLSFCTPDGRVRILHLEAEPEDLGPRPAYSGVLQDVTDRRQAEDRIRQLAHFDALTGLPNRRQLIWRAERAIDAARRQGHQVALLLIDLDRFKNVNDTLGHAAGDELLVEVSRRLRACVRHTDQLMEGVLEASGARSYRSLEAVGRLGGDEFVALLPEIGTEPDAERVAQRVLQALRVPVSVSGQDCFVTGSVGIAVFPRDGQNVADLLRNADVAMYAVKDQGRNAAAQFAPQLGGKGRERLELESALHKALEREELVLHYQPKVDVQAARLVGVEALMRWRRGDKLVSPADFIPLAEETGLIVPFSEWALAESARQAKRWQQQFGFDQSIAVNLPNRLFEREDLVEQIHQAVSAAGIVHGGLQLEITETGLMKDLHAVIPILHRLTAIGVQISIDDFGTGYSSLSYLTSLPLAELKIDRSFVRDLGISPQSTAVVSAIIALARSLGLRVIAEGVETERQMAVLQDQGCHYMQGYLFAKPLPGEALDAWYRENLHENRAAWCVSALLNAQAQSRRPPR